MSPRTVGDAGSAGTSARGRGSTDRIGLVFVRQTSAPHAEPFFNQVMVGLDDGLTDAGRSLLVRRVDNAADELAVYRQWHHQRAVDAVVVKDLVEHDPRPGLLHDLGISYVMLADVTQLDGQPAVHTDNAQSMRDAMAYLIGSGHRHIARVAGPTGLIHTRIRTEAFVAEAASAQITGTVVSGDYSEDSGRRLTSEILASTPTPTAVVFDNDLMAVGGLSVALELGIAVPDELSLLAWDDSGPCQLARPSLSALSHDVYEIGVQVSRVLIQLIDQGVATTEAAAQPVLVPRGTTGRAGVLARTPTPTREPEHN